MESSSPAGWSLDPLEGDEVAKMKYGTYQAIIEDFLASGKEAAAVTLLDADGNPAKPPGVITQGLRAVITRKGYEISVSLVRGKVILER